MPTDTLNYITTYQYAQSHIEQLLLVPDHNGAHLDDGDLDTANTYTTILLDNNLHGLTPLVETWTTNNRRRSWSSTKHTDNYCAIQQHDTASRMTTTSQCLAIKHDLCQQIDGKSLILTPFLSLSSFSPSHQCLESHPTTSSHSEHHHYHILPSVTPSSLDCHTPLYTQCVKSLVVAIVERMV